MVAHTLKTKRERLIAELNSELSRHIRRKQAGLSPRIDRLLSRIHLINQRMDNRQRIARKVIEKQDELAHKIFDLHMTPDELAADFAESQRLLDDLNQDRYA